MTIEEMEGRLTKVESETVRLGAVRYAYRDLLARLLGYLSSAQQDPERMLKDVLEATDRRLEGFPADSDDLVEVAETMRGEMDWIVASARAVWGSK